MVCCDLTLKRSLFHFTGAAVAKPYLSKAFLGWSEETDCLFLHRVVGRLMVLKMRRLYLKRIQYIKWEASRVLLGRV